MSSPVRPRPPGVDDLLQDYLKVINDKDTEILNLVSKVQGLETELRKTEERAKTRVRSLKESATELQSEAESAVRRLNDAENLVGGLQRERDELRADVETLRDAMYRQDHDLRTALRAAEKAQKSDAMAVQDLSTELDAKTRDAQEMIAGLESRLQTTTRSLRDSDDERNRLLKECAALQSRLEDRENQVREMKRQKKAMVPRDEVANEVRAIEARSNSEVSAAMRELERLRAEHTEEVHRGQRRDNALGEAREELRRNEAVLGDARRNVHEAEMRAAQTAVQHAQRVDEMRADIAVAHDKIAALEADKTTLEQDRHTLQTRLEETKRMMQNNETSLRAEVDRLHSKNMEAQSEVESMRRMIQQQDGMITETRNRAERIAEERGGEVRQLREEVNRFSVASQQNAANAANNEKLNTQLREDLRREHDSRLAAETRLREMGADLTNARHSLEVQAAESQVNVQTIAELRRDREECAMRAGRAEGSFRDAQEEIRQAKSNADRVGAELQRCENALATERTERNRLEGRVNADSIQLQRLGNELQDRDQRIASLESNFTQCDAQRAAATEELARLRTHIDQITNDSRMEIQNNRDAIRRMQNEMEDLSAKLSSTELMRDDQAKEITSLRSKEAQLQSLLQSKSHELQAANERAESAEALRSALDKQNQALHKQSQELQMRVDELRGSYGTLQTCFDKQQEQLDATQRAREHESSARQQQNNTTMTGGNNNNNTNTSGAAGASSPTPAAGAGGATPTAAGPSPSRNIDNISALPARGPTMYSTSGRAGFSPGMYSSVIAGPGAAASPYSGGGGGGSYGGVMSQSVHVSPSRRGLSPRGGLSPQPRAY